MAHVAAVGGAGHVLDHFVTVGPADECPHIFFPHDHSAQAIDAIVGQRILARLPHERASFGAAQLAHNEFTVAGHKLHYFGAIAHNPAKLLELLEDRLDLLL